MSDASPRATDRATRTSAAGARKAPVEIGVQIATNADSVYRSVGVQYSIGNPEGYARAVIEEMNRRGGLAGRKIVPVFAAYDAATTRSYAADEQTMCSRWTEDHRVAAAVVVSYIPIGGTLLPCLTRARVPVVYGSGASFWGEKEGFDAWPLFFTPNGPSLDRWARFYVERLHAQGFFEPRAKIGLLRYDTPAQERVARMILAPALARHGLKLTSEVAITHHRSTPEFLSSGTAQAQSAALRFRSESITHVLFMSVSFLFMAAAESNAYRPRYGLSSNDLPEFVRANVPAAQLERSLGVGWLPFDDVNDAHDPGQTEAQKRCLALMKEAGQDTSTRSAKGGAIDHCDALLFLQSGANEAGTLTPRALGSAFEALGSRFVSGGTFRTTIGPGRHDGTSVVRDFAYSGACSCFNYRGGRRAVE